jgi:acyl dehydratase
MRFYEDILIGDLTITGPYQITRDEIIDFASKWDPAYFHIDEEKAKASPYGGLTASGAHVFSIYYKLCYEMADKKGPMDSVATLGFEVKYPNPARPGDELTLHFTPIEKRESQSNPRVGIAKNRSQLVNQNGEVVLQVELAGMYKKRPENAA